MNEGNPNDKKREGEKAVETVRLDFNHTGTGKFVLCKLTHKDGTEEYILRANSEDTLHRGIVEKITKEFPDTDITVLGGGILVDYGPQLDHEMEISNASTQYGKEDRKITKSLLSEAYPDREITVQD